MYIYIYACIYTYIENVRVASRVTERLKTQ